MEDEDGYMAIKDRRSTYQEAVMKTVPNTKKESPKCQCWKVMLLVLLVASLLLNVVLMVLFGVFELQSSCPQDSACSCDWIPGCSKVNVTLDSDTAHPRIDLTDDGRTAAWGAVKNLPNLTERFDHKVCVLGTEGFLSDKHCWEVQVKGNGEWGVGVAKSSVQRKGLLDFRPQAGIWGIGEYRGHVVAFTSPEKKDLLINKKPRRIRVYLDYKYGQVEFFNVETKTSIYLFNSSSFGGEEIFPWFHVWDGTTLRVDP